MLNPLRTIGRHATARNLTDVHAASMTLGDRIADAVARFGGSWTFILLFVAFLALWMGANSFAFLYSPLDPYPFIFLNLILSCLAALQAPVIMMSQNRQAARDRRQADHDYEVNLKAEQEIEELHQKLDLLREDQWAELVRMQQRQIACLEQLLAERAHPPRGTPGPGRIGMTAPGRAPDPARPDGGPRPRRRPAVVAR